MDRVSKLSRTACSHQQHFKEPPFEDIVEEDQRLKNWRKWLEKHSKQQKHLTTVLKREPLQLALNSHEKIRSRKETEFLIEAANAKYLEGETRFEVRQSRTKKQFLKTKPSDNLSKITRVGLPRVTQLEKSLVDNSGLLNEKNFKSRWESSDYLTERKCVLSKEIAAIEAKKPEIDDLAIIGRRFCRKTKIHSFLRPPVISISPPKTRKTLLNDPDSRAALNIQTREFVRENDRFFEKLSTEATCKLQESKEDQNYKKYAYSIFEVQRVNLIIDVENPEPIIWTLTFETTPNEICRQCLRLENRGVFVINYNWKLLETENGNGQFLFDRNPGHVLPGEILYLPIDFVSEFPVVYTEIWNLLTVPRIYPGEFQLRLWATSFGNIFDLEESKKSKSIEDFVDTCIRNVIIQDIIESIFETATMSKLPKLVPCCCEFYKERDIFEAKNSIHQYDWFLVEDLKLLASEVDSTYHWDLSLEELREVISNIQDVADREIKLEKFSEISKSLLKSALNQKPTLEFKFVAVKALLIAFFDKFDQSSHFVMNKNLISASVNSNREILFTRIYCLLSETVEKICDVIDAHNYYGTQ